MVLLVILNLLLAEKAADAKDRTTTAREVLGRVDKLNSRG
jgi:hypothetical protein